MVGPDHVGAQSVLTSKNRLRPPARLWDGIALPPAPGSSSSVWHSWDRRKWRLPHCSGSPPPSGREHWSCFQMNWSPVPVLYSHLGGKTWTLTCWTSPEKLLEHLWRWGRSSSSWQEADHLTLRRAVYWRTVCPAELTAGKEIWSPPGVWAALLASWDLEQNQFQHLQLKGQENRRVWVMVIISWFELKQFEIKTGWKQVGKQHHLEDRRQYSLWDFFFLKASLIKFTFTL